MKIGIHHSKDSFSDRWIAYCNEKGIPYKIVNCYKSDIIDQLADCDALMWHFHQQDPKALLFSKQLHFALETSGKKVFPDFRTMWHFDDKVGQKYLLEAFGAPLAPSWIFYDKNEALRWIKEAEYPLVFKLRKGSMSANVRLIKTKQQAEKLIKKCFNQGLRIYNPLGSLKERYRKYRLGLTTFYSVFKGIIRFLYPPRYSFISGRDRGYVYFQKFIPDNDHDIRVIVIGNKAFAIKRIIRKNDFRASGSGNILYEKEHFSDEIINLSFDIAEKLKSQCIAFDFVFDNGHPLIVEISYGFSPEGYDPCTGYWDRQIKWHKGKFDPYGWMVEGVIKDIETKGRNSAKRNLEIK
jgi:glutathione synthase/RimK-type ligase-like ATP-grasp enzyme